MRFAWFQTMGLKYVMQRYVVSQEPKKKKDLERRTNWGWLDFFMSINYQVKVRDKQKRKYTVWRDLIIWENWFVLDTVASIKRFLLETTVPLGQFRMLILQFKSKSLLVSCGSIQAPESDSSRAKQTCTLSKHITAEHTEYHFRCWH